MAPESALTPDAAMLSNGCAPQEVKVTEQLSFGRRDGRTYSVSLEPVRWRSRRVPRQTVTRPRP